MTAPQHWYQVTCITWNFSGLWWWCWQPWLVLEQFLPLVVPCVFSLLASSSCYKWNNLLDRVRRSDKTFVVNTKWFIPDLRSGNNFWEFRIQILTIFKHIWKLYWTTSMVPYNRYKRRIYGTNYLPFSCSHSNIFKGTGTVPLFRPELTGLKLEEKNLIYLLFHRAGQTRTVSRIRVPDAKAFWRHETRRRASTENDIIVKDVTGHRREISRHWC